MKNILFITFISLIFNLSAKAAFLNVTIDYNKNSNCKLNKQILKNEIYDYKEFSADQIKDNKDKIDGQEIKEILTVNGVRFSFEDGSWGLVRASSNKPSLVVVIESPTSNERKIKIFNFIDDILQKTGKIGEYDQKI